MRSDRFGKRGAFTCSSCGRRTREAGDNQETCPDCWELAGIYNTLQDSGVEETRPYTSEVERRCRNILTRGGKLDSDAIELLKALIPDQLEKIMETQTTTTTPSTSKAKPAPRRTAEKLALKTICSQLKIDPKAARRLLRKAELSFHAGRERWSFTAAQAEKVREILKESSIERQSKKQ